MALVKNPFAGRYIRDLQPAMDDLKPLGLMYTLGRFGSIAFPALAALLQQLDVYVTGDTGPMYLAHAVGTPIVAIFGPSDPARYAPHGPHDRVVRIDLPCAPCNRIRLPPARCVGHTPDCLAGITTASVLQAIDDVLRERSQGAHPLRTEALG